ERREARRPTSLAGDPWRSRDRPNRKAGHGVRRSVSAPLGAPPPSRCAGRKNEKGEARPPSKNQAAGRRSIGFFSPPPCGEGLGVVVGRLTHHSCPAHDPPPQPSL